MSAAPSPGNKTCAVCAMEIPERARKCTHCDQWQSLGARLVTAHLQGLVTLLPIITLCIAFLGQLDLLWQPDLDAFAIRCAAANSSGALRRFEGQTLILSARNEPAFLAKADLKGADGTVYPTERTVYNGGAETQLVSSTPIDFRIDAAQDVVTSLCAGQPRFDIVAPVLSLSGGRDLRIGSCQCD